MVGDRVQVRGVGAVMFINELLCKLIVEKNPGREVYLEESYPLKSFYPQSVPHGFVLKINHQAVDLSKAAIKADRKFWAVPDKSNALKSLPTTSPCLARLSDSAS